MFPRSLKLPDQRSFFLFGPRGTGKSTLLAQRRGDAVVINLLKWDVEDRFARDPGAFGRTLDALPATTRWVVVDEIQKLPSLLDEVHRFIEEKRFLFALTGSSARKLKRGGANLLAGRAFVRHLHPLTHRELGETFDLDHALALGTLPEAVTLPIAQSREFLSAYTQTYVREEIQLEQVVRKLLPFRRFLDVSAQSNGEVINFTRIAEDVGVDHKTVQSYFQILEDTGIGFFVPAQHRSVRKQQRQAAKFYWFDTGVCRAVAAPMLLPIEPRSYAYGRAFEHWLITETWRLCDYAANKASLSYLRTKDGAEIDLIVERPGVAPLLIEIKSTERVGERDAASLVRLAADWPRADLQVWSRDGTPQKLGRVRALPWQVGLLEAGF